MVSYQLLIRLEKSLTLRIGALGEFHFPQGYYIYTGSAKKNIEARLRRHMTLQKRKRWHIDYLLSRPEARVLAFRTSSITECILNQKLNGAILVRGFGSSDCRKRCGTHLKRIQAKIAHEILKNYSSDWQFPDRKKKTPE